MRIILRIAALAIATVFATGCAVEHEPVSASITILDYGILEYDEIKMKPDETSSLGARRGDARGLHIVTHTDQIPIEPGLTYGIRFVVHARMDEIVLRAVQRSANPCIMKGSGKKVYYNDSILKVRIGDIRHIAARFPVSESESICEGREQPGIYIFELYFGGSKLAQKVFYLHKP